MTSLPPSPLFTPSNVEWARFTKLFEGYARVESVTLDQNQIMPAASTIDVRMQMTMPDGVKVSNDEEVRTLLFWQAQECLRILGRNGYKIFSGPDITLRGEDERSIGGSLMTLYYCELEVVLKGPDWKTKTGGKRK